MTDGRYKAIVETWKETDDALTEKLIGSLDKYNNIFLDGGFRRAWFQPADQKRLTGMRGLMARPDRADDRAPIKSNFREGLDVLSYFISAHF